MNSAGRFLSLFLLTTFAPEAPATTWYVRPDGIGAGTSWGDPLPSVQTAIDSATAGDEIWVASGTYNESLTLKTGIALYGGFSATEILREERDWVANQTILDATGLDKATVLFADDCLLSGLTVTGSALQGIFIQDGDAGTVDSCVVTNNGSSEGFLHGGIVIYEASATVNGCRILGNRGGEYQGGGLPVVFGTLTLTDSLISENESSVGGGVLLVGSSASIAGCTITENTAKSAGGLSAQDVYNMTLVDSSIIGNRTVFGAGGIGLAYCVGDIKITDCVIEENIGLESSYHSGGGGIFSSLSTPVFSNCVVANNFTGGQGGGIRVNNDDEPGMESRFVNCSVVGNRGGFGAGGIFFNGGAHEIVNCIFWNFGQEAVVRDGTLSATYSCVQGGWTGEGNLDALPQFLDPDNGDYRLRDNSPCIDRGLISAAPEFDIRGVSRPGTDGSADIGAYESSPEALPGPAMHTPRIIHVKSGLSTKGNGESWTTAFDSLTEALENASTNDELWVAGGSYQEQLSLEPSIPLWGGFTGGEVDREERDPRTNRTLIVHPTGELINNPKRSAVAMADNSMISGFTITGASRENVSGVAANYVKMATLSDCRILDNRGTGLSLFESSLFVRGCEVADCEDSGVFLEDSTLTLEHSGVNHNLNSGIYAYASSLSLSGCRVDSNTAEQGGGLNCLLCDRVQFENTFITRNHAFDGYGGAAYVLDSTAKFLNSTVASNAAQSFGGIYVSSGMSVLLNSIFSNNNRDHFNINQMEYSRTDWGSRFGENNIDSDPKFVNPTEGDFRLACDSPCIDSGHPDFLYQDACLPPGQGTVRNDMGAYGGDGNCVWRQESGPASTPVSTCTPTSTQFPTHSPTPTDTPSATSTPDMLEADLDKNGEVDAIDLLLLIEDWRHRQDWTAPL